MAALPPASQFFPDAATAKLAEAAGRGDAATVRQLVAAGTNPNALGTEGMTPLLFAIASHSKPGAKALLEAGADPNLRARDGESALTMVASGTDTDWLRLLLAFGGDANARNAIGEPILVNAGLRRNADAVRILLDAGADIEATDDSGSTVTLVLARMNQFHVVAYLLGRNADALHRSPVSEDAAADYIFHADLDPASPLSDWQQRCRQFLLSRGIAAPLAR
ncbi:ankyrin repeat domain-containing protein [Azospirillum endophyticum]|nr:ankyrin repeat domain-containing protein [Azospirillum endophyticum]